MSMPLITGTYVGPVEVTALLGAGGMSACGHTEPRPWEAEAKRQHAAGVAAPSPARAAAAHGPCRLGIFFSRQTGSSWAIAGGNADPAQTPLTVVLNWPSLLRSR